MFLVRKLRFKKLTVAVVVSLSAVAMVTLMLAANNEEQEVGRMQPKIQSMQYRTTDIDDARLPHNIIVSDDSHNTLSPRLKLINSSTVMRHQLQRQRRLADACKRLGLGHETPNFKSSDMYVNDTLNYVYCVVNKVACTSWKRALLMASDQMTVDRPEQLSMTFVHDWRITDRYFPRIRTFSLQQVRRRLQTHFKFMFVRHPLERLVSTYRDKFTKKAYYYPQRFGRKIVAAVRGANASEQSLKRGHDVTFPEMVAYLLDPPPTARARDHLLSDNHWRQQHLLCHPCYVRYDFIGHHETMHEDAGAVLRALGVADRVRFPATDPNNRWPKKTTEVAAKILAQIGGEQLRRVKQLYAHDFELFGYDADAV